MLSLTPYSSMQTRITSTINDRMLSSQQHRVLCRGPLHTRTSHRQSSCLVRAEQQGSNSASEQPPVSNGDANSQAEPAYDPIFPKRGLFSIADPKQEVYSKAGEVFDPTKKGGRWKPEFIWQTNWQEALKRQEDLERQQAEYRQKLADGSIDEEKAKGPGVVSFSRLGALEDLNVDLTEELRKAKQRKQQQEQKQAAAAAAAAQQRANATTSSSSSSSKGVAARPARQTNGRSPSYQFKDLPTQSEARRYKRSSRLSGPGTAASVTSVGQLSPEEKAARAAAAAAEKARYEQLKVEFQGWTFGLGLLGGLSCYYLYGSDVAISYALGSSAALTYLRLLTRSVDAVGDQATGSLNSAIGQPRLLIPVVLALTYNRWNAIYADDYGVHLDFYGMLVGFFTYKLAVVGRQGLQLLSDLSAPQQQQQAAAEGSSSGSGGADDAMSLDRIFVRKVMSE